MKNIKKLGIALTFIAFSSVACSTNSTEEASSNPSSVMEETSTIAEEVSSDMSSAMEETSTLVKEVSSDIASIIENPVVGEKVTLQGKITEKMEDCYIFTDGENEIMLHFEDEIVSYDPNTVVKISGTLEDAKVHDSDHFEAGHDHDGLGDTMILVDKMEVIASNKS